ncbi:MAG: cupin domain-containing protein [Bdellovibrionales bacterium]|nr:cupin domain-containing protein [Bdellovibrionales bacterium]
MKEITKLIETSKATWKQANFESVEYIPLQMDFNEKHGSMVVKMLPNAKYPKHRHTKDEELFLLKGTLQIGDQLLKSGDFLYSQAGTVHHMQTTDGCVFLMNIPGGIELITESQIENIEIT